MTKIEEKRKELEETIIFFDHKENCCPECNNCLFCNYKNQSQISLNGFNLGVEMARKEILNKLTMFEVNIRTRSGTDCLIDLAFIENTLEELKQSLGEKQ